MEVVAAAIGVAEVTARSAHRLWRLCEAWRDAPREVFQLRDDLSRAQEFYSCLKNDVAKSLAVPTPPLTPQSPTGPGNFGQSSESASNLEKPPPWSPPGVVVAQRPVQLVPPPGPTSALLGLIKNGGAVLGELESIIDHVTFGKDDSRGDDTTEAMPKQPIASRRRVVWLMKASKVKKLRSEMTKNMLMVSGALLTLNASTTTHLVESVATLTYNADAYHQELKQTFTGNTAALVSRIDAYSVHNDLRFRGIERQMKQLHGAVEKYQPRSPFLMTPSSSPPATGQIQPRIPSHATPGLLFCDSGCTCRCHHFRSYTSWKLMSLENTLGYLDISAMRLRVKKIACNYRACSQSGIDGWYKISYRLPLWLASTTIMLFCSFSAPRGFGFNLRVSRHYAPDAKSVENTIFSYIRHRDVDGIRLVLEREPCSVTDKMGPRLYSVLHLAMSTSLGMSVDGIKLLLQAGADPFQSDAHGRTPMDFVFNSWLAGDKFGRDVMALDTMRGLLFEYLERFEFTELQKVIIGTTPIEISDALRIPGFSGQINQQNTVKTSALELAVCKGDLESVECLLRMGADPNIVNASGAPPLHKAVFFKHRAIVELLVRAGSMVDTVDKTGLTPMHLAAAAKDSTDDAIAILRLLLSHGADINALADGHYNALTYGLVSGDIEVTRWMIRHGADINNPDWEGDTALADTVRFRVGPEMARLLLKNGADYTYLDTHGQGILHRLAESGTPEIIRVFREAKLPEMDVDRRDVAGRTALDLFETRHDASDELRAEFMGFLDSLTLENFGDEVYSDEEEFHDADEYVDEEKMAAVEEIQRLLKKL